MADGVGMNFRLADNRIKRHQHQMKFKSITGVHLHLVVFWQCTAGWHLHNVKAGQPRIHAIWQPVDLPVCQFHNIIP